MRLALLVLLASCGEAAKRNSRHARNMQTRRRDCERITCAGVHEYERENCILRCRSEQCYERIYGAEELEPGEIDAQRTRLFNTCESQEHRTAGSRPTHQRARADEAAADARADQSAAEEASENKHAPEDDAPAVAEPAVEL